jgi:polygalacturonase
VAINSGQNIIFKNGYCHGGHGLSIGSVGGRTNNIVKNVTFTDTVMENSQQSVRIKTISGANGTVDGITYRNIVMKGGDDYGILVDQSYNGVDGQPTNGVSITNFALHNVTGTVLSSAVNIHIECGVGSCSDWTWSNVKVTGGKNSSSCLNVPTGITC